MIPCVLPFARTAILAGAIFVSMVSTVAVHAQASFTSIGDLSGGGFGSQVRAVSEDGSVAVGSGTAVNDPATSYGNGDRAIYYTPGGGITALPSGTTLTTGSVFMTASDVTPDGSIVVGRERESDYYSTPRYAAIFTNGGTTLQSLGALSGATSQSSAATAVSDNGTVVYGYSTDSAGKYQAFRWTSSTGMVGLGFVNGSDTESMVAGRGTSADGSVAVGTSSGPGSSLGFIYTEGSGMQSLGLLAGGTWSSAVAVTADGSIVFGVADSATHGNGELFMWTESGGMIGLGAPTVTFNPSLMGVSADGSVVTYQNYIYNASGFHSVESLLTGASIDLTGWSDLTVLGVSDNGNILWGSGNNPSGNYEGWYATFSSGYLAAVPEPSTWAAWAAAVVGTGVILRRQRQKRRRSHV